MCHRHSCWRWIWVSKATNLTIDTVWAHRLLHTVTGRLVDLMTLQTGKIPSERWRPIQRINLPWPAITASRMQVRSNSIGFRSGDEINSALWGKMPIEQFPYYCANSTAGEVIECSTAATEWTSRKDSTIWEVKTKHRVHLVHHTDTNQHKSLNRGTHIIQLEHPNQQNCQHVYFW